MIRTAFAVATAVSRTTRGASYFNCGHQRRLLVTMSSSTRQKSRIALGPNNFVDVIPILSDNFCYLIGEKSSNCAVAVDPAEPDAVLAALKASNLTLSGVLTTHHHWDHSGGNAAIRAKYPTLPIFALSSDASRIPGANTLLDDGQSAGLPGTSLSVKALHTPCHTTGHACYVVDVPGSENAVFTGDTLFVGGCGKFFEGSGDMMEKSLNQTLAGLDNETLVFCGHEYTLSNLKFALSVEPDNAALKAKMAWAKERVARGEPTVPSSIGAEKTFNPFMRTSVPEVAAAVNASGKSREQIMSAIRAAKNRF